LSFEDELYIEVCNRLIFEAEWEARFILETEFKPYMELARIVRRLQDSETRYYRLFAFEGD